MFEFFLLLLKYWYVFLMVLSLIIKIKNTPFPWDAPGKKYFLNFLDSYGNIDMYVSFNNMEILMCMFVGLISNNNKNKSIPPSLGRPWKKMISSIFLNSYGIIYIYV